MARTKQYSHRLQLYLTTEIRDSLIKLATETGTPLNTYVRELIEDAAKTRTPVFPFNATKHAPLDNTPLQPTGFTKTPGPTMSMAEMIAALANQK